MTVSSETNRQTYSGNGVTVDFDFLVFTLVDSDVVVILKDSSGADTTQAITSDYTISVPIDRETGVRVTMLTSPATGETLIVFRDPAFTQSLDLVENDSLPAEQTEEGFDKTTMLALRNKDLLSRSPSLPDGDTSGVDVTLPTPEALKVLGWSSDGLALQNFSASQLGATVLTTTFTEDWLSSASAAVGRSKLGIGTATESNNLIPFGDAALNPHQRGDSVTGISDGQQVADQIYWKQSGTMVVDYAIGAGSETNSKSFEFTVTTGDASLATADLAYVAIPLEGKNVAHLNYGGSDVSSTTYAFKVRAKKAGVFCASIMNSAGDRVYIDEITIDAADIWEPKIFTIPGDSAGTWLTDTGIGLKLIICLAAGTDHHGAADDWLATGDFATSNQANFVSAAADYFELELIRVHEGDADLGANYPEFDSVVRHSQRHFRKFNMFLGSASYLLNGDFNSQSKIIGPMRDDPVITQAGDANASLQASWLSDTSDIHISQLSVATASQIRVITMDSSWVL